MVVKTECLLLPLNNPFHFLLNILSSQMRIGVQSDTNIRMSHQVLQCLGIHSAFGHVGAEDMPAHMGRYFGHWFLVNTVVLGTDVLKVFFPVQSYHWHAFFIQIQEAAFASDERFIYGRNALCNDSLKTKIYFIAPWNCSNATSCFLKMTRSYNLILP